MKAFGYTTPALLSGRSQSFGGFIIVLYGDQAAPFAAAGAATVDNFARVIAAPESIRPLPEPMEVSVGSPYPFGFQRADGTIVVGSYDEVADVAREEFSRFADRPFSQVSIANFVCDPELFRQAVDGCAEVIRGEAGDKRAEAFRRSNGMFRPFVMA